MPKRESTQKHTSRRTEILREQEERDRFFEQFGRVNSISNPEERNRKIVRTFLSDIDAEGSNETDGLQLASHGTHAIEWFRQMLMQAFEKNGVVKIEPYQCQLNLDF